MTNAKFMEEISQKKTDLLAENTKRFEDDDRSLRRVIIFKVENNGEPLFGLSKEMDFLLILLRLTNSRSEVAVRENIKHEIKKRLKIGENKYYNIIKKFIDNRIIVRRSQGIYWINSSRLIYMPDKHYKYNDDIKS